ncbi:glycosyltransferase family 4 protein [Pseudaminobacter soli (ex Li et al. 2025)]|uniref:glycosyltransferase family 4 protein n=1 Tax=Pseudaminobacter soli (ex Li et al. 2025) TaxID=1295366 RepID=UPI0015E6A432|nr:glycosyltransferase family 4 protein [Mesorhizobium soli]
MADPVWFWQRIVSPHMAGLAEALARRGQQVSYVAEQPMSTDRAAQGWRAPRLGAATLHFAPDRDAVTALVAKAPEDSIHICQGLRGNGLVGFAQQALARRGLSQWVVMETVDDSGWRGAFKRLEYRRLIRQSRPWLAGLLATGDATPGWLVRCGMPSEKVFPFAYFLPERWEENVRQLDSGAPFRFLFVGQFIDRKRVDLLFDALARLGDTSFELALVGFGPLEGRLRMLGEQKLPGRVRWQGQCHIDKVPPRMAKADCLVLPSHHDGWGAVVCEALMVGTPVVCSDRCGAATAVRASGCGGVFPAGEAKALAGLLQEAMAKGRQLPAQRKALAGWARRSFGASAGASYLEAILQHAPRQGPRPVPPWQDTDLTHAEWIEA